VEKAQWDIAVASLEDAAERVATLSRCLDVADNLRAWKQSGTSLNGASAADALDQARGDLERLAGGQADELLQVVTLLLDELPVSLE
jgi:hypothetical protein